MCENEQMVMHANQEIPKIQFNFINNLNPITDLAFYNITNIGNKRRYGDGKEASMIRDEIGDFDLNSSEAMELIKKNFGGSLRITELKGIINAIRDHLSKKNIYLPKLTRNANRSFQLCVKYVQDHIEWIKPLIPYVKLLDNDGNAIPVNDF